MQMFLSLQIGQLSLCFVFIFYFFMFSNVQYRTALSSISTLLAPGGIGY